MNIITYKGMFLTHTAHTNFKLKLWLSWVIFTQIKDTIIWHNYNILLTLLLKLFLSVHKTLWVGTSVNEYTKKRKRKRKKWLLFPA